MCDASFLLHAKSHPRTRDLFKSIIWREILKWNDRSGQQKHVDCERTTKPGRDTRCAVDGDTTKIGVICTRSLHSGRLTSHQIKTCNEFKKKSHRGQRRSKYFSSSIFPHVGEESFYQKNRNGSFTKKDVHDTGIRKGRSWGSSLASHPSQTRKIVRLVRFMNQANGGDSKIRRWITRRCMRLIAPSKST